MSTVGELIQKVGEEDRLIFSVGEQKIGNDLLKKFEAITGITKVTYQSRELKPAPGLEDSAELVIEKKSTGSMMVVRSGQVTDGEIVVYAKRGRKALPELLREADDAGISILSVEVREPDLEAVFLHLTGRELRE